MAEFVCFDPKVEVRGQVILSIIAALGDWARPTLAKHGFDEVLPDQWYSLPPFFDAFKELSDQGFSSMVACGQKIPDIAVFPPIGTVEQALMLLGEAYQMNHQGGDIGEYTFKKTGERQGQMYCRNPYPSDFDYGIIYRLMQKYCPKGTNRFKIMRDDTIPNRKTGADACTFHIEW